MRRLRLVLVMMVCGATLFTSCRKDEAPAPEPAKTTQQLICGNLWTIDSITLLEPTEIDDKIVYDMKGELEPCELDDYINFRMDGTGALHSNVHVCQIGPATQDDFNWAYLETENKLVIDFGDDRVENYKLIDAGDNFLHLETFPEPNQNSLDMRFKFKPAL